MSLTRFRQYLADNKLDFPIHSFGEVTRTASEAAAALGCQLGQICKSLVFKDQSGQAVLVIVSGVNRLDTEKLAKDEGLVLVRAEAEEVKAETGFSIGGVPPFGHLRRLAVYIDKSLAGYPLLYAAAGDHHSVFEITFDKLREITQGKVVSVC